MSADGFAAFRRAVLCDPTLQRALLEASDRRQFVPRLVVLARAGGWDVGPSDVEEAIDESRRAWRSRWI